MAVIEIDKAVSSSNKLFPMYNVILLNDDYHTFEFVIYVICTVFKKELPEAFKITKSVHETGQGIVTTCTKERAELYLEQVEGPKGSIGCIMEPVE
jgi:ATP-dependent Clp protease adaptor protein ClpS